MAQLQMESMRQWECGQYTRTITPFSPTRRHPPAAGDICRVQKQKRKQQPRTMLRTCGGSIPPPGSIICQGVSRKSMENFSYKTKKWNHVAAIAMRRDGYICQISKRYGKRVPAELVHHIYPVDEYPEYAYCLWNLISLSRAMHNTLHDRNTDKLTAEGVALMRRTKPQ